MTALTQWMDQQRQKPAFAGGLLDLRGVPIEDWLKDRITPEPPHYPTTQEQQEALAWDRERGAHRA